jgi:nucleotide-binding universal stress UspA family protein
MHIYFDESVVTYRGHAAVLEHKEEGAFEKFLAGVDLRGVAVETLLEESSSVPHAIHRAVDARGFDLVVMGTRGRSASAAVLLGSETDHMLQECPMPLLAVKHFGARLGVLEALLDKRFRRRDTPHFG